MDISKFLKNTGVQLDPQSLNTFGANTTEFGPGAESQQSFRDPSFPDGQTRTAAEVNDNTGIYDTTNYAQSLASGLGGFDPKMGFLFKVSFEFDTEVAKIANQLGPNVQSVLNRNLTFLINSITMPKFKFNYQEFNYYNFRTKMLSKTEHEPLSFKMYDDTANNALAFINVYLQLTAPIHRTEWSTGADLENNGFAFSKNLSDADSGQRAVFGEMGNQKNILRSLKIEQYYLDRSRTTASGQAIRNAIRVNIFTFTNPKMESFDLPDQSYDASGEAQQIMCTFDYDALHIKTDQELASIENDGSGYMEMTDILADRGNVGLSATQRGPSNSAGGGGIEGSYAVDPNSRSRTIQPNEQNGLFRYGMGSIAGGNSAFNSAQIGGILGTNAARTLELGRNGIGSVLPRISPRTSDNAIGGTFIGRTVSRLLDGDGG